MKSNSLIIRVLLPVLFILTSQFLQGTSSQQYQKIADDVVGITEKGEVVTPGETPVKVVLSSKSLYHYEILNVLLFHVDGLDCNLFKMKVYHNGILQGSAGEIYSIPFLQSGNSYRAIFLPDWNAEEGEYEIHLYYGQTLLKTSNPLTFKLLRRPLPPVKMGLSIIDLETNKSLKGRNDIMGVDGTRKDATAILEWARFMKADALWVLTGETTSFKKRYPMSERPYWDSGPYENLSILKKKASRYGVRVGAYIICFYVPGPSGIPSRYRAGIGYDQITDLLYRSKHISLASEQRIRDIIEMVKELQEDPLVHYIGFDFIRTGRDDGYELVDRVAYDTNIQVPDGWKGWTEKNRIKWFARKIKVEKDPIVIEKWRWWRAHYVAALINRIIREAGVTKPVWVYTLGWNHGKEHGQDPVMFFDAGVTIDAVMLYESNRNQFLRMLTQWKNYMSAEQGNIIVGNCVDYLLLDSDGFSAPQEFYRRDVEGARSLLRNGIVKGIFFHDVARALWGRKGPYRAMDYAIAHLSALYNLNHDLQKFDLLTTLYIESQSTIRTNGYLYCKNGTNHKISNITISLVPNNSEENVVYRIDGKVTEYIGPGITINSLDTFESVKLHFSISTNSIEDKPRDNIIFKVTIGNGTYYYVTKILSISEPDTVINNAVK